MPLENPKQGPSMCGEQPLQPRTKPKETTGVKELIRRIDAVTTLDRSNLQIPGGPPGSSHAFLPLIEEACTPKELQEVLNDPLVLLTWKLRNLAEIARQQETDARLTTCIDQFQRWEQSILSMSPDAVRRFLLRDIRIAENVLAHMEDKNRLKVRTLRRQFTAERRFPGFMRMIREEPNGSLSYTSRHPDGQVRRWRVEFVENAPQIGFFAMDPTEQGMNFSVYLKQPTNPNAGFEVFDTDPGLFDRSAEQAVISFRQENNESERATVSAYEFPPDRLIVYLRMFPKSDTSFGGRGYLTSMLTSNVLRQRYGDRCKIMPPIVTDDPATALTEYMQIAHNQFRWDDMASGGLHFVTDIYSHGERGKGFTSFTKPFSRTSLEASLQQKRSSNDTMCSGSLACFGADLVDAPARVNGRLSLFTQTQSDTANYFGFGVLSSLYHAHFLLARLDGKSHGEAHRIADRAVRETLALNPESLIDGQKFSVAKPQRVQGAEAS